MLIAALQEEAEPYWGRGRYQQTGEFRARRNGLTCRRLTLRRVGDAAGGLDAAGHVPSYGITREIVLDLAQATVRNLYWMILRNFEIKERPAKQANLRPRS